MQILSTKLAVIYFSKEELFYLRYKFSQNSTLHTNTKTNSYTITIFVYLARSDLFLKGKTFYFS